MGKKEIVFSGGRSIGKSYKGFLEFQDAIKSGKTVEYHGKDYVCMSRNQYEKLSNLYKLIKGIK